MQKYLERERARARTNVLIIYSYDRTNIKKEKIDEREIFQLLWYIRDVMECVSRELFYKCVLRI